MTTDRRTEKQTDRDVRSPSEKWTIGLVDKQFWLMSKRKQNVFRVPFQEDKNGPKKTEPDDKIAQRIEKFFCPTSGEEEED